MYSSALSSGSRCVVTLEGFYEFKKSGPQPAETYYFQSLDDDLLKAAGLFSALKLGNVSDLFAIKMLHTYKIYLWLSLLG